MTQDIPLADLTSHPSNYNRHSDAQIARIATSLSTFGQVRSIVVRDNTILAGHGVVLAAKSLGWETIRADVQDHLTEAQALAYVVADNELARQSDPDQAQLAAILEELQVREPLLVEAAGYTSMELEQLLASLRHASDGEWGDAMGHLPNGDRAPFTQMTFTLHDSQAEEVKRALDLASDTGNFIDSPNANSNGNALAYICESFLGNHHG